MAKDMEFLDEIMNLKDRKEAKKKGFFWLYPFTNENIKAYYSYIDFKNKDVLCVTSSGDHALNAILLGAKNISSFDINPLAKYYSELKIAAIKSLSLEEFIMFFYDKRFITYKYFFNKKLYKKFSNNLKGDYKEFWDYFFDNYTKMQIFKSYLISEDYLNLRALFEVNLYLKENNYYKLRELLKDKDIVYYDVSLKELNTINNKFDIVLLSNISAFLDNDVESLKNLRNSIDSVSNKNAEIVVNYFYDNLLDYSYNKIIYDIEEVTKIFPTEEYEYKSFESSHNMQSSYGLRMLSDKYDKVLLTKKKK